MPKLPKYHGIKKGYPRLRRYFGKLVAYIQLCRVFTLVAPLLAGLFGVLSPVEEISFRHLITAIYVGLTLAFAQACGQCLNQYADAELDGVVKPYRAIPSGRVTKEEALGAGWLLAIFAVGRAFTVSTFFGLVVLSLIFFAVFYSLAPFSPRRVHPLLNTGWMAISRGFIPMYAVLSIYGDWSSAWRYGLLAFVWVMGFQATKDVSDSQGDKKFGIKTIVNTYGSKGLTVTMIACSLFYGVLCVVFGMYTMLFLLLVAAPTILLKKKTVKFMENNCGWIGMYIGLAVLYLLMFIN